MKPKLVCMALALAIVAGIFCVLYHPDSSTAPQSAAALAESNTKSVPAEAKSAAVPADPKSVPDLRTSYFGGKVKAECRRSKADNEFTVMFYEKGSYRVSFEQIPATANQVPLPRTVDIVVEATPQTKVFQVGAADCIRATITRKKVSESHDFR